MIRMLVYSLFYFACRGLGCSFGAVLSFCVLSGYVEMSGLPHLLPALYGRGGGVRIMFLQARLCVDCVQEVS